MTEREKSEWDQAVVEHELSGRVAPKSSHAVQYQCDPIEWAAKRLYQRMDYRRRRAKQGHEPRRVGRDPVKKKANQEKWLSKPGKREIARNSRRLCDAIKRMTPKGRLLKNLKKVPTRAMCDAKKGWRTNNRKLCLPEGIDIMDWMESQFSEGMTRENYGTYWEVDHYFPVARIDHDDPVHVAAVNDHRNLRPMTKEGNRKKKDKIYRKAQVLFIELVSEKRRNGS